MSVNGLEKMTERILGDARAEAERILAEAQQDCEKISADYATRADEIRERLSDEAEKKASDLIARAKSAAAMQKRNLLLQQQSDLIDGVFEGAREWVQSLNTEQYTELLAGLLAASLYEEADTAAKNRAVYGEEEEDVSFVPEVLFNKKDREKCGQAVVDAARKKLSGKIPEERLKAMTLSGKTLPISGGVVLRCGEVEFNCSFEMLFSQLRRELEADVSRALFEIRGQA